MKKTEIKRNTDTVEKLENALLNRLETKSIQEIRVRELCELAQVNHQTFYNHFYDCLDLYEEVERKALEEGALILASGFSSADLKEQSEYIGNLRQTKYFVRLIKQKENASFKESLTKAIFPTLEEKIKVMSRERERRFLTTFILNGSLSVLEAWIKGGCAEAPEYIASLLYKISGTIDLYHSPRFESSSL